MHFLGKLFREEGDDRVIQGKTALCSKKENGHGGEAFADGKHAVRHICRAGGIVPFEEQLILPCEEKTVHGNLPFGKPHGESLYAVGGNTGFFRSCFFKCQHR